MKTTTVLIAAALLLAQEASLVPAGSPLLLYANDVNDRGEIVGQAVDQDDGSLVAFVAIPRR